ncbi:MAG: class I SAM-dependent methyltransferase [Actinomycetota bacterium]
MTDSPAWNEGDSDLYRRLAPVAVPSRARQLATLTTLLPFGANDDFRVVEIGSGEGLLSDTIARAFENVRITALDGSETMRAATAARLAPYGGRVEVGSMILEQTDWLEQLDGADAIVSSLVIHHLDGAGKKRLFEAIARRTSARAALLIADLVEPPTLQALELFAASWDESVRNQARAQGGAELFDLFRSTEWNIYRVPDPMDQPSPLADQLRWLSDAGFAVTDCFALEAGHAIYGGYKETAGEEHIDYARALRSAEEALGS